MDFDLTRDQQALAERVRELAARTVAPYSRSGDREGRYRPGLLADLGSAGLFGVRLPREHGGSGLDAVSVGIVLEELAAADLSVCFPVLNAALVGGVLASNATPEQIARWMPAIASGEAVVALGLTEPAHGTDAAAIEMRAEPAGDGWVLSGEKTSIMAAGCATHVLMFARSGAAGPRGITAFYLSIDGPRVKREVLGDLGCRAGERGRIVLDGLPVNPQDVVGAPGEGFIEVMRGFGVSRALIALMAVAVGRAALDEAVAHAGRRTAFGRPLGTFQGVAFPLTEHSTKLHAARLVAFEALTRADAGEDPRVPANMAKWWAPLVAMEAVHQALLTLGHLGWSQDGPVEQRLRDVIGLQLADGTAAATKLVLARQMLGREHAP